MHVRIITAIIVCHLSFNGFSQEKILLHSFTRHFEIQAVPKPPSSCYGVEKKAWHEDYVLNLFSDSTFTFTYFYSGGGNYYHDHKHDEKIKGRYFKINGIVYLEQDKNASKFCENTSLDAMFFNDRHLRIEYDNNALSLYEAGGRILTFKKPGTLDNYKKEQTG